MKSKIKIIAIIVVTIVLIIACSILFALNGIKSKAVKALDSDFEAIKSGDVQKISEYTVLNLDDESESDYEILTTLLKNVDYKVIKKKSTFKDCTLIVEVTNKDMKTVLSNYVTNLFSLALSNAFGKMTDEDMKAEANKYLDEQCVAEDIENITTQIEVRAYKENSAMKLEYNKVDMQNAILPGYTDAIEYINSFNSNLNSRVEADK